MNIIPKTLFWYLTRLVPTFNSMPNQQIFITTKYFLDSVYILFDMLKPPNLATRFAKKLKCDVRHGRKSIKWLQENRLLQLSQLFVEGHCKVYPWS